MTHELVCRINCPRNQAGYGPVARIHERDDWIVCASGANDAPMKTTISFPSKSNNEQAQEAFLHQVVSAQELMTVLRRHLDDHMGFGPDEINWAHVGDANRFRAALQEIADTFNLCRQESTAEKPALPKTQNDHSTRFRAGVPSLTGIK